MAVFSLRLPKAGPPIDLYGPLVEGHHPEGEAPGAETSMGIGEAGLDKGKAKAVPGVLGPEAEADFEAVPVDRELEETSKGPVLVPDGHQMGLPVHGVEELPLVLLILVFVVEGVDSVIMPAEDLAGVGLGERRDAKVGRLFRGHAPILHSEPPVGKGIRKVRGNNVLRQGMMDEHYFSSEPSSPRNPHPVTVRILGESLAFVVDRGIFSASGLDAGTRLLIENLPLRPGLDLLDIGCGWGPIGLVAKRRVGEGRVVMVDTNRRALELARQTAGAWGLAVDLRQGDGFGPVSEDERFDLIVTNPPIRAGKAVYYRWAAEAPDHLRPGGAFFAVVRVRQGAATFERHLRTTFEDVRREDRRAGYWVLSARVPR